MINSQSQKGGDGSNNVQAQQIVVNVGVDEKRAREIYQEMQLQTRNDYSEEALKIANARISEFEGRLLPKMEQVDGALEAFADPSFQLLLVEAQKTAASTERPQDYDLLSELLIHRFQKGQNRIARAGISLAVGIVDKVSDEALLGLTVAHAVNTFTPISGSIAEGLNILNDLFGKIFYDELPTGNDWLDHLDILNAVRLDSYRTFKKVHQYYPESLSGYVDVGINKKSENYNKAVEILNNNNLPSNTLIDTINSDFVRLILCSRNSINAVTINKQVTHEDKLTMISNKLSEAQIIAIDSIYDLYLVDENLKQNNTNLFMAEWDKWQNLKTLTQWWDNIPKSFTITTVGKVLAHSNAQRCDKSLPALD